MSVDQSIVFSTQRSADRHKCFAERWSPLSNQLWLPQWSGWSAGGALGALPHGPWPHDVSRAPGQPGNDTLNGIASNDVLFGGSGDDSIQGNMGNDRLFGGLGNDLLGGRAGDDLLVGGRGDELRNV